MAATLRLNTLLSGTISTAAWINGHFIMELGGVDLMVFGVGGDKIKEDGASTIEVPRFAMAVLIRFQPDYVQHRFPSVRKPV